MRMFLRCVTATVGLCAAAAVVRADVTFSDTEFLATSWGFETASQGTGGTSSAARVSNGNPGFAREVTNAANGGGTVYGFSRYGTTLSTRYAPSESGAILSVDFTIDARWIGGAAGPGQSIMLGAKQGQVLYFADLDFTGTSGAWTAHGATGLTSLDFQPLTIGPAIDFSATGEPLRFGFVAGFSGDEAATGVVRYDNFGVTIRSVPVPGTLGVLGLAGLALAARRR